MTAGSVASPSTTVASSDWWRMRTATSPGHGKRPRSAWLNGAVSKHDGLKKSVSQSVSPGGFAPHLPVTSCLGCEHVGEPEPSGPGAGDGFQVAAVDPRLDRLRFHTGLGGGLVQGELYVLDHRVSRMVVMGRRSYRRISRVRSPMPGGVVAGSRQAGQGRPGARWWG